MRRIILSFLIFQGLLFAGNLDKEKKLSENYIGIYLVNTLFCSPCEQLRAQLFREQAILPNTKIFNISLQIPFEENTISKAYDVWNKIESLDNWPLVYITDFTGEVRAKFRTKGKDNSLLARIVRIVNSLNEEPNKFVNEIDKSYLLYAKDIEGIGLDNKIKNEISKVRNEYRAKDNLIKKLRKENAELSNKLLANSKKIDIKAIDSLNFLITKLESEKEEKENEIIKAKSDLKTKSNEIDSLKLAGIELEKRASIFENRLNKILSSNKSSQGEFSLTFSQFLIKQSNSGLTAIGVPTDYTGLNKAEFIYKFSENFAFSFYGALYLKDYFYNSKVINIKNEMVGAGLSYILLKSKIVSFSAGVTISYGRFNLSYDSQDESFLGHLYTLIPGVKSSFEVKLFRYLKVISAAETLFPLEGSEYWNSNPYKINLKPETFSFTIGLGIVF